MDHLVALIDAFDARVLAGHDARPVELVGEHRVEDRVDQRGLARPGNAGDDGHHAEREAHGEVLEVVLARADDFELLGPARLAPHGGHLDLAAAGDVVAGDRTRRVHQVRGGPGVDDIAAVLAGARADVDQPVGLFDGLLVVLDDDQRVAEIAQVMQRFDEPLVVALVQTDGRLVEHVHDADEPGADLRGESDALRLAARQGLRGARQRQVVEPDVVEEPEPCADLLEHLAGDPRGRALQVQPVHPGEPALDGHVAHVGDGLAADGHGQHLGAQTAALARLARHLAHVRLVVLLHLVRIGLVMPAHERAHHALEAGRVLAHTPPPVAVGDLDLEVAAVHDRVADLLGQVLPRGVEVESHLVAETLEHMPVVLAGALGEAPWLDRAFVERLVRIGNDQFRVDLQVVADARARRAGAVGRVEGEGARLDLVELELVAVRAGPLLGERLAAVRVGRVQVDVVGDDDALGEAQRRFDRVGEPLADAVLDDQTVDHHLDRVLLLLGELDVVAQLAHLAVDERAGVAVAAQQLEQVLEFALAAAHHGGQDLEARALRVLQQRVDHLLRDLRADQLAAFGAVRHAGACEQQAQVVVDLGDRADRRTRVAVRGLLVDRHGRAQALDEIDVRLVHLPEELAGVGRQRLDVPALPLGEQRVEGERGLARTGQAGEHDHAVARHRQVHVLEVVLAGALDRDLQVVGDMRDISYERIADVAHRRLSDLAREEGVAGHHLFDHDLAASALAGCLPAPGVGPLRRPGPACVGSCCCHGPLPPIACPAYPSPCQEYPTPRQNSNVCSTACCRAARAPPAAGRATSAPVTPARPERPVPAALRPRRPG